MGGKANHVKMLLCVLLLVLPVRAQYGGGTGEPNDPYLIYTAEHLDAIRAGFGLDKRDKHFKLMADIDLSGYTENHFHTIGISARYPFTGTFDGNGHSISNFTYITASRDDLGLFQHVRSGHIRDLTLIAPNVDAGAGRSVGALVGYLRSGTITNCHVEGGHVSGRERVGGLVGRSSGTIANSSATCDVSAAVYYGGGLVGSGSAIHCWAAGNVSGSRFVGGLLGSGSATHCYALGSVSGRDGVGGLVGTAGGWITYCYAVGSVSGTADVGGLLGRLDEEATVFASFWDIEASGQATSGGGVGKTTAEMMDPNMLRDAGWDFIGTADGPGDSWAEPDGGGYPILWWQTWPVPSLPAFSGGTGKPDDPYLISVADELNSIGSNQRLMVAHFRLTADIDLAGIDFFIIGGKGNPFRGTFDGGGHTISNLSHISEHAISAGLFGHVRYGSVTNLGLIDPTIDVERGDFHASLVGYLEKGSITDCYAQNVSISGNDHVGGLVGWNGGWSEMWAISRCYVTGHVAGGDNVGGLVGMNYGTTSGCYAVAEVDGNERVGGLVGWNWDGTIADCYAIVSVSGHEEVGGLVGRRGDLKYSRAYLGEILRCYSAGGVFGDRHVGGLIGFSERGDAGGSFWDIESTGQSTSAGGQGRTTAQMQSSSTFVGWGVYDAEGTWSIDEGRDYPRLWWENAPGSPMTTKFYGGGRGTESDPYLIYTAQEFLAIGASAWDWGKHFRLMKDVDLAAYSATAYRTIGYHLSERNHRPFTGVFDGNGHTIFNFISSSTDANNVGLFGYVESWDAEIRDLGLIEPDVAAMGDCVGPLVGLFARGIVTKCFAEGGSVSGNNMVGGVVGWNSGGTITDCYASVSVSGYDEVGGLAGRQGYSDWFGSPAKIHTCYSAGSVSGDRHAGGLTGRSYVGVSDSFWDIEASGQASSGGGMGKTTAEMQTLGTFLDAGWDFVDETVNGTEDIWHIREEPGYPTLAWKNIEQ